MGIREKIRNSSGGIIALGLFLGTSGSACIEKQASVAPTKSQESCVLLKTGEQIPVPQVNTPCFLRNVVTPAGNTLAVVTLTGFEDEGTIHPLPASTMDDLSRRTKNDSTEGGRWAIFLLRSAQNDHGVTGFNTFNTGGTPAVVTFDVSRTDLPDTFCVTTKVTP